MNYPKNILMVTPEYFDVVYQINDHMDLNNKVDKSLAKKQWQKLKETYQHLGFTVVEIPGVDKFPDMVFTANQIFSTPHKYFLGKMKHVERAGEVDYLKNYLKLENTYQLNSPFEAMGDWLWDYSGERIFAGFGFRTSIDAYEEIKNQIDYKIIPLELVNSNFYHLDTALSIVRDDLAFFVPSAFNHLGIETLKKSFKNLIPVNEKEAIKYLACNAHSPDGKILLVESGAIDLQFKAMEAGLEIFKMDTSEFLKSGGSIFCLKNQGWF